MSLVTLGDWIRQMSPSATVLFYRIAEVDRQNLKRESECLHCGERIEITQPVDHSEYTPMATCPNCERINTLQMDPLSGEWLQRSWEVLATV